MKANYSSYRSITISTDCVTALLVDSNVSASVISITDETLGLDGPVKPIEGPPNSQSVVLSLNHKTIEANLILEEIAGCKPPPLNILAPSIRHTPVNKVAGREQILLLAFPTLYPTGQADFNTLQLWNVPLKDYIYYLLYWYNQQFVQYIY